MCGGESAKNFHYYYFILIDNKSFLRTLGTIFFFVVTKPYAPTLLFAIKSQEFCDTLKLFKTILIERGPRSKAQHTRMIRRKFCDEIYRFPSDIKYQSFLTLFNEI